MTKYNPLTPEIVAELGKIVGEDYVVYGDNDKLEPYSHDEVPGAEYRAMPGQWFALAQQRKSLRLCGLPINTLYRLPLAAPVRGLAAGRCLSMAELYCFAIE